MSLALVALLVLVNAQLLAGLPWHLFNTQDGADAPPSPLPLPLPLPFVIDTFQRNDTNDLGFWHGPGEDLPVHYHVDAGNAGRSGKAPSYVRLYPTDPDQNYHTQLSASGCFDLAAHRDAGMSLRVVFGASPALAPARFSIGLTQNNAWCDPRRRPYPETWDSVEAHRYLLATETGAGAAAAAETGENAETEVAVDDSAPLLQASIPLSHFAIDHRRVLSVSVHGFYPSGEAQAVTLHRVEIVAPLSVPVPTPTKLPTAQLVQQCMRPNSFAFGIDDGQPQYAQQVLQILDEEDIKATFFVVGRGLDGDQSEQTNLTAFYRDMSRRGHQIALHSYSHPKLEGLASPDLIDAEIRLSQRALRDNLGLESRYFRPPFGTVGARTRQRLAALLDDPYVVGWSVDIEDWRWAESDWPQRQIDAFARDVGRGGSLAVLHFLHPSTVSYLRDLIRFVRASGRDIMRVDQCMGDPASPA